MKKIECEIFSETVNAPVIRHPGRHFPGVLIQGDSLSILWVYAKKIAKSLESSGPSQAKEDAEELCELLDGYKTVYEKTLEKYSIRLPYEQPII